MKKRTPMSPRVKVNVAGMVVAASGILMQYFFGAEGFPLIPPGPIILLVAAAVVASRAWRWTPIVGVIAPLFVLVGGTIATIAGDAPLTNPDEVGSFVGAVIQFLGSITALVAGILAAKQNSRDQRSASA